MYWYRHADILASTSGFMKTIQNKKLVQSRKKTEHMRERQSTNIAADKREKNDNPIAWIPLEFDEHKFKTFLTL